MSSRSQIAAIEIPVVELLEVNCIGAENGNRQVDKVRDVAFLADLIARLHISQIIQFKSGRKGGEPGIGGDQAGALDLDEITENTEVSDDLRETDERTMHLLDPALDRLEHFRALLRP